jgi:hypothetical protein
MHHNYNLDVVKSAEPFMLDVWEANKICYIVRILSCFTAVALLSEKVSQCQLPGMLLLEAD